MNEKDPLKEALRSWKAPDPPQGFEVNVLSRLHAEPHCESFWQRWFVEPWGVLTVVWREQAVVTAATAALALVLGVSVVALQMNRTGRGDLALFRLDIFQAAPRSSITSSYMEMMKP